jgi:isopentenyl phosphate kinase
MPTLIFLKLGGSLITEKARPHTPRMDVIRQVADEIRQVLIANKAVKILLGHGSGSYGHMPAQKHGTRQGVTSPRAWHGFAEVWHQASTLNRIIIDCFVEAGVSAVAFPASSAASCSRGQVIHWNLRPLQAALEADLLPVVYGDVVFDDFLGGTILSTEEIFSYLADKFLPKRILLAGLDAGVWEDFPQCKKLISEITPDNWARIAQVISGSQATDVTGGMASKVAAMLELTQQIEGLQVSIFSGQTAGNIAKVLENHQVGTLIRQN